MLKIKKKVSADSITDLEDVYNLKAALNRRGYYEEPDYGITPYADKELFEAIESFQEDNDLKRDGVVNPDGETLKALNELPEVRSPSIWCPNCGGPHGGSKGDLCPSCDSKK